MSVRRYIVQQFERPHGALGRLAADQGESS